MMRSRLENFPIRYQGARYVGRQSLPNRKRPSWEGPGRRSRPGRLRLEGSSQRSWDDRLRLERQDAPSHKVLCRADKSARDCRPTCFPPDMNPYTGMKNALIVRQPGRGTGGLRRAETPTGTWQVRCDARLTHPTAKSFSSRRGCNWQPVLRPIVSAFAASMTLINPAYKYKAGLIRGRDAPARRQAA
jgi:hypothetical protein